MPKTTEPDAPDTEESHDAPTGVAGTFNGLPTPPPGYRRTLGALATSRPFSNFVLGLIVLNAITLGMQTSPGIVAEVGGLLDAVNAVILAVFVIELVAKLIAWRLTFFRSGWNVFDFIIVGISLVPASDGLTVLRTLRVLRLLRLISQIPKLREIVESIGRSLSGLMWTSALLGLVFYIFAVMGTMLFATASPENFGSLGQSLLSLFQVMTLDNWNIMYGTVSDAYPYAWLFFVPFILIASFMVLNLFIAVIVNATSSLGRDEDARHHAELVEQVRGLSAQLTEIQQRLEADDDTTSPDVSKTTAPGSKK